MVNEIRTIYLRGLNKMFGSKFCVGFRVRHGTPEEGRKSNRPKHCGYNDEDEDNNSNTLRDKNYQALSQKFRQIIYLLGWGGQIRTIFPQIDLTHGCDSHMYKYS